MNNKKKALIASIFGNSIFGFSFLFSKVALDIAKPTVMLAARFSLAFIVLNALVLVGGILKKQNGEKLLPFSLKGKPLKYILALAIIQPVIYFIAESYGIAYTSSAFAGTIIAVIPLVGIVMDILILHVKVTPKQVICSVGSVIGVGITTMGSEGGNNSLFGIVMLFIAVLSGALFYVFSKKAGEHYNPLERTYMMFAVGSVVFVSMALIECRRAYNTLILPVITNTDFWGCMIYLSICSSVIAFMILNYASSVLTVGEAALFANLTTVISIIAGVTILKESFTIPQIVGAVIIISSVYLANRNQKEGL